MENQLRRKEYHFHREAIKKEKKRKLKSLKDTCRKSVSNDNVHC